MSDQTQTQPAGPDPEQPKATLEEDDEFEDFPIEDWPQDQQEVPDAGSGSGSAAAAGSSATEHLWEESWDDDDTSEDFSKQLQEELKKVEAKKG